MTMEKYMALADFQTLWTTVIKPAIPGIAGAVSGIKVGSSGSTLTPTQGVIEIPAYEAGAQVNPGVMGASGDSHASGLVPDTPTTAGTSKYLREDGTWAEPAGFTDTTYSLSVGTGGDANKIVLTPSSGNADKITVPYASDAGTVNGKTVAENVPSGAVFTDNNTTYKININGTDQGGGSTSLGTVYAPSTAGTSGQYLKSSGNGAPEWENFPTIPSKMSDVAVMSVSAISSNTSSSCSITGAGNAGKSETIIYTNSGSSDLTVTVPTTYATPENKAIELTCVAGGYCEVNYLNIGGTIYARGL